MSRTLQATDTAGHAALVDEISSWLTLDGDDVDRKHAAEHDRTVGAVRALNKDAAAGDPEAFRLQQLLLSRIHATVMRLPEGASAEGSVLLHEVTRLLENATVAAEDRYLAPGTLRQAPAEPRAYLSWLKGIVRRHRAFKHPYYTEFIRHQAGHDDLRTYVIQESLVDGRFDDLLAMMQVGTAGAAKMEIANNFWDEMGNGDPDQVHTRLFNKIYEVFDVREDDMESAMTANDLLTGNLAVLVCRYRRFYPEAVGFLGMTEWLVPDRFTDVVHAWERLGLPPVGITYHRLHITVDSQHAAGWFHHVVLPAAADPRMRKNKFDLQFIFRRGPDLRGRRGRRRLGHRR
ncbi:iron-containing redox enzyme family protein, partial [Streptomyces sp. WELS2]|uniref:iron-containing redox enzyme family protein n=1 Tax=Streptomyces sp. WELS2 TaxID=2749435 RepID=UPI0028682D30